MGVVGIVTILCAVVAGPHFLGLLGYSATIGLVEIGLMWLVGGAVVAEVKEHIDRKMDG